MPSQSVTLKWIPLTSSASTPAKLAVLALNRPDCANALNAGMLDELSAHLRHVKAEKNCRLLLVRGTGKHFSAGADLAWMQASAHLSYEENLAEAEKLSAMFESLYHLPVPTLAVVQGAAYGGAVGLAACCDFAIATDTARFCLSEVKLGVLPAVIFPYLASKMQPGQLRRLSLSAQIFQAKEAYEAGLIERYCPAELLETTVRQEIAALLQGSQEAQKSLKVLTRQLAAKNYVQGPETALAIAKARVSAEAQAGFQAFFAKKTSPWVCPLENDLCLWEKDH